MGAGERRDWHMVTCLCLVLRSSGKLFQGTRFLAEVCSVCLVCTSSFWTRNLSWEIWDHHKLVWKDFVVCFSLIKGIETPFQKFCSAVKRFTCAFCSLLLHFPSQTSHLCFPGVEGCLCSLSSWTVSFSSSTLWHWKGLYRVLLPPDTLPSTNPSLTAPLYV